MNNKFDILNKVTKAEAPPFLYTRITQHIHTLQQAPASVKFKFAFALMAALVLILNVLVLTKKPHTPPTLEEKPAYSSTINNIYYE